MHDGEILLAICQVFEKASSEKWCFSIQVWENRMTLAFVPCLLLLRSAKGLLTRAALPSDH